MGMLFDELSDDYLRSAGVLDILKGVPVPIAIDDDGHMTTFSIASKMAKIIGADKTYPYADKYMAFIDRVTQDRSVQFFISEGARAADEEKFEEACMMFRAALTKEPKSQDALYLYGRACQGAYEREELDEDYVGNFKAESLEAFELLTVLHPNFAMGYYFLGYAYLNLGLYTKARLTWEKFIELTANPDIKRVAEMKDRVELRDEINERLLSLNDPVIIENACNQIMSGDFLNGRDTLMKFREGRYETWWPLWYYLGVAEESLGNAVDAIKAYKKALVLSPSNTDVMQELSKLYLAVGDEENSEKYRKKIEVVKSNIEAERNSNREGGEE